MLLETEHINAANPLFIEIGIPPDQLGQFGVTVVAGRSYTAAATHEMMLGWRAAQDFGLHVGDRFTANGTWNTVVGIYSTGISYGDLGGMFPLTALQTYNRVPGAVTLVFVKLDAGHLGHQGGEDDHHQPPRDDDDPDGIAIRAGRPQPRVPAGGGDREHHPGHRDRCGHRGEHDAPVAVRADPGIRPPAGHRLDPLPRGGLVVGEGVVLALIGAAVGVGLSFAATVVLERLPQLSGVLHANYTQEAFWRGLYTGLGMAVIGALYPALRAANLKPLKALSRE